MEKMKGQYKPGDHRLLQQQHGMGGWAPVTYYLYLIAGFNLFFQVTCQKISREFAKVQRIYYIFYARNAITDAEMQEHKQQDGVDDLMALHILIMQPGSSKEN